MLVCGLHVSETSDIQGELTWTLIRFKNNIGHFFTSIFPL